MGIGQGGNAQRTRDFEICPTGHVRYTVAQDWIIGGSFTRRVDRLRANDLDETVKYSGPLSYFSGRRDLKPEKTSAYELELEHEASGRNYLATGYYRSTSNRIGTLSTLRADGAILDRRANIGEFRTAGLELVASGSVGSTITYKLTGRFAWNEVSGAEGAGSYRRSAWTPSSQANVNWKITDHDFVLNEVLVLGFPPIPLSTRALFQRRPRRRLLPSLSPWRRRQSCPWRCRDLRLHPPRRFRPSDGWD